MAFIRKEYCYICCKDTYHTNGECDCCVEHKAMQKHREHFAKLDSMTLEERIRRLEKFEYELLINPPWVEPTY